MLGLYFSGQDDVRQDLLDNIAREVSKHCQGLKDIKEGEIFKRWKAKMSYWMTADDLEDLVADVCATMATINPDYSKLALRIVISKLHKETKISISDVVEDIYNHFNRSKTSPSHMLSKETFEIIQRNADILNSNINHSRDYNYSYFGFKTLKDSCLLKINSKIVERPQHLIMRVAVGIHGRDLKSVIETYNILSENSLVFDLPILLTAGMCEPRLSSHFLMPIHEDRIIDTYKEIELISSQFGQVDIGLGIHCMRAVGNDDFNLHVWCNVLDTKYASDKNTFTLHIEAWHKDIFYILKNHGSLRLSLWIPDLFMERVEKNDNWTLMCPSKCQNLHKVYGEEFDNMFKRYENERRGEEVVNSRDLWSKILECQSKEGMPFMIYKDSCNVKSNHKNLGTINSSISTEIMQYSDCNEIVCNTASIALNRFVRVDRVFDFKKLEEVVAVAVKNLNKIIDINYSSEVFRSNTQNRPIGLGVQGLADTFILMRCPFESMEAKQLNKDIFETIYYSALKMSSVLSKQFGPYENYEGSPISKGIIQPDMWGITTSERHNWADLREQIKKYGVRNSLLVALMPTSSTSSVLENSEGIEPHTGFSWINHSGDNQINYNLHKDLVNLDIWDDSIMDLIIANKGSIQNIANIPADIKALYKTAWEIHPTVILDMAADRAPYIDQSQSMNIYMADLSYSSLNYMHFYGWRKGLKTGMYYLKAEQMQEIPTMQCRNPLDEPPNINYGNAPQIVNAYANLQLPNWPAQNLAFNMQLPMPNNLDEILCVLREQDPANVITLLVFTKKIISTEIEEMAKYITKFLEWHNLSFNISFRTVLQNTIVYGDHRIQAIRVRHFNLRMVIAVDPNIKMFFTSLMTLLDHPRKRQAILFFGDATVDGWKLKGKLGEIPELTDMFAVANANRGIELGVCSMVCAAGKFRQVFNRKILDIGAIRAKTSGEDSLTTFLHYINERLLCESPAGNNY